MTTMAQRDRFDLPPPWIGQAVALAVLLAVLAVYALGAWLDGLDAKACAAAVMPVVLPGALGQLHRRWLAWRLARARRAVLRCKLAQLRQAGRLIEREAIVIELEQHLPRRRGVRA
jgi:hypothetical protein